MRKARSFRIAGTLIIAVSGLLLWTPVAGSAPPETPRERGEPATVTAPVMLDGEPLFRVGGVTARPAEERARLIGDRIAAVAADRTVSPDSLRIVEVEGGSEIRAGDRLLVTIVEADADVEDVQRQTLALANL